MEWHRRLPGFYVAFLLTFTIVAVLVATDRPSGATALLGTWGGPELGVWWEAVTGFVLGLLSCVFCGLLTGIGAGLLAGFLYGGMCASAVGTGLRGSPDDVAFGVAAMVGVLLGMVLLRRPINALAGQVTKARRGQP